MTVSLIAALLTGHTYSTVMPNGKFKVSFTMN